MTARTINVGLLRQVLDHVSSNPAMWDQSIWRSATRSCFGGWAVQLTGAVWVSGADGTPAAELVRHDEAIDGEHWPVEGEDEHAIHVSDRAQTVLGLADHEAVRLFQAPTDLEWVTVIVDELMTPGCDTGCAWVARSHRWGPHELYLPCGLSGDDVWLDRLSRDLYVPLERARRFRSSEHARAYARRYWGSEQWVTQHVATECRLGRHDEAGTDARQSAQPIEGRDRTPSVGLASARCPR